MGSAGTDGAGGAVNAFCEGIMVGAAGISGAGAISRYLSATEDW